MSADGARASSRSPDDAPPGRRLVILRHGETTFNAAGIWQGQVDAPLSELGERQADAVGPALASLSPTRVVASDLVRARLTGEAVGRALGIPVTLDARFREIAAGAWEGLSNAEVAARWPEERAAVRRGEDVRLGVDGESMSEVAARVADGLRDLLDTMAPGECVVIATHGAAGRIAAAHLLDLDQRLAWRALGVVGNCHWSELLEGALGWRVVTWNAGAPDEAGGAPERAGAAPGRADVAPH